MFDPWPFDQEPRAVAITTRQVLDLGFPILRVVHYSDEADWAFTCGTTNDSDDARLIAMEEALQLDASLAEIANLPLGWGASRPQKGGVWSLYPFPSA